MCGAVVVAFGVVVHRRRPRGARCRRIFAGPSELRVEGVDPHRGGEEAHGLEATRSDAAPASSAARDEVRVEDRSRAVADRVHGDLVGVVGHPRPEPAANLAPPPPSTDAAAASTFMSFQMPPPPSRRAAVSRKPSFASSTHPRLPPDRPPPERIPQCRAERRLPDEVDGVDAVLLPPVDLLQGDARSPTPCRRGHRGRRSRSEPGRARGPSTKSGRWVAKIASTSAVGRRELLDRGAARRRPPAESPPSSSEDDVRAQRGELRLRERVSAAPSGRPCGPSGAGLGGRMPVMMRVLSNGGTCRWEAKVR